MQKLKNIYRILWDPVQLSELDEQFFPVIHTFGLGRDPGYICNKTSWQFWQETHSFLCHISSWNVLSSSGLCKKWDYCHCAFDGGESSINPGLRSPLSGSSISDSNGFQGCLLTDNIGFSAAIESNAQLALLVIGMELVKMVFIYLIKNYLLFLIVLWWAFSNPNEEWCNWFLLNVGKNRSYCCTSGF